MRTPLTSQRGLSLAEVTIMLMVLSVLSGVMSPVIGDYVNDARHVKAAEDVQVLAVTFSRFVFDARLTEPNDRDWQHFDVLVGAGSAPALGPGGEAAWLGAPGQPRVGLLEDHLMTNSAGYDTSSSSPVALWSRGWRGPYLNPGIGPDPWGHRYAINVGGWAQHGANVIVLSAGPDGQVETPFLRHGSPSAGDDVIAVIGSGGQ